MPFPSRAEYEGFIYGLTETYSAQVSRSTLKLYSVSALAAIEDGDVFLHNGLRLHIVEVLDFKTQRIRKYSYEIYRGEEKISWYDPQPHPGEFALASTFPHHRHEPPDIKHNRQAAPGITFEAPNLPTLIADCMGISE